MSKLLFISLACKMSEMCNLFIYSKNLRPNLTLYWRNELHWHYDNEGKWSIKNGQKVREFVKWLLCFQTLWNGRKNLGHVFSKSHLWKILVSIGGGNSFKGKKGAVCLKSQQINCSWVWNNPRLSSDRFYKENFQFNTIDMHSEWINEAIFVQQFKSWPFLTNSKIYPQPSINFFTIGINTSNIALNFPHSSKKLNLAPLLINNKVYPSNRRTEQITKKHEENQRIAYYKLSLVKKCQN